MNLVLILLLVCLNALFILLGLLELEMMRRELQHVRRVVRHFCEVCSTCEEVVACQVRRRSSARRKGKL